MAGRQRLSCSLLSLGVRYGNSTRLNQPTKAKTANQQSDYNNVAFISAALVYRTPSWEGTAIKQHPLGGERRRNGAGFQGASRLATGSHNGGRGLASSFSSLFSHLGGVGRSFEFLKGDGWWTDTTWGLIVWGRLTFLLFLLSSFIYAKTLHGILQGLQALPY
jgi:hypothetical protein